MLPLDTSVLTAAAMGNAPQQPHTDASAYNDGQWGNFLSTHFHSINDKAPVLQVNIWSKDAVSNASHIFIQHDLPSLKSDRAGGYAMGSSPLIPQRSRSEHGVSEPQLFRRGKHQRAGVRRPAPPNILRRAVRHRQWAGVKWLDRRLR